MVKGWIGAAGRGVVGAAPLMETPLGAGNWSYPANPGMQVLIDGIDVRTENPPTGIARGAGNWPYTQEVTTEPILDAGARTNNPPTGLTQGWSKDPFNACLRGLAKRTDKKIRKPWEW